MKRPDRDTRACVNPECHLCRRPGAATLTVRQVSGHDRLRLLRCRTCGEECSERRGTAWFHPKRPEAPAEEVINHWGEGWSVRATARLGKVATETVARLLRGAGRHAEWGHEQHGHGITPKALECDEHWSVVKKSRSAAQPTRRRGLALCGTPQRWPQTASGWGVWGGGQRTQEQTQARGTDARRRLRAGPLPASFPAASAGSAAASLEACGRRDPAPRLGGKGRAPHPILRWPQGVASGQVHKPEKGHRGERVDGRALSGKARLNHVWALRGYQPSNPRVIDRQNGTRR